VALGRRDGPTALALTRKKVTVAQATAERAAQGVARGAYVTADPRPGSPDLVLLATGSELEVALEASRRLEGEGLAARVVSMPSFELFAAQERAYRDAVLPPGAPPRLAIEAGTPFGWHRWIGERGAILGLASFGASAPAADLARHFGITAEAAVAAAKGLLEAHAAARGG
jgi:transketolase